MSMVLSEKLMFCCNNEEKTPPPEKPAEETSFDLPFEPYGHLISEKYTTTRTASAMRYQPKPSKL